MPRQTFKRHDRIKRQADFELLTRRGGRIVRGPLVGFVGALVTVSGSGQLEPRSKESSRLGIRIGRRVGSAVVRNRIKRLLREAFRLSRHDWPIAINLVVSVQPHAVLSLSDYRSLLSEIARHAHKHRRSQPRKAEISSKPTSE